MSAGLRTLATCIVAATFVPMLGAQSVDQGPAAPLALAPAGVVAAHHAPVSIPGSVPEAWRRSIARADSVDPRKRAFHIGALAGAVAASGFALAVMQPWDEGGCEAGPDARTVAGVMLVSAVPGALLGGVAGVIVHDVHGAATRR